jgi:hypothetical protein
MPVYQENKCQHGAVELHLGSQGLPSLYLFWGHLKFAVYDNCSQTIQAPKEYIPEEYDKISTNILHAVWIYVIKSLWFWNCYTLCNILTWKHHTYFVKFRIWQNNAHIWSMQLKQWKCALVNVDRRCKNGIFQVHKTNHYFLSRRKVTSSLPPVSHLITIQSSTLYFSYSTTWHQIMAIQCFHQIP